MVRPTQEDGTLTDTGKPVCIEFRYNRRRPVARARTSLRWRVDRLAHPALPLRLAVDDGPSWRPADKPAVQLGLDLLGVA